MCIGRFFDSISRNAIASGGVKRVNDAPMHADFTDDAVRKVSGLDRFWQILARVLSEPKKIPGYECQLTEVAQSHERR